jgi:hypothetical protein
VPTPQELEQKFWKALKTDMTLMLGLDGVEDGHARPMTAQLEHDDRGPIWFFTAKDHAIVQKLPQGNRAIATFASPRVTICSPPSMAASASITIVLLLIDCGTAMWRLGSRAERKIQNLCFCVSILSAQKFGATPRASSLG